MKLSKPQMDMLTDLANGGVLVTWPGLSVPTWDKRPNHPCAHVYPKPQTVASLERLGLVAVRRLNRGKWRVVITPAGRLALEESTTND